MNTTILNSWNWAEVEFTKTKLGHVRRTKRLIRVASTLAANPQGILHKALPSLAELKAAYRLLEHEQVTYESVSQPHKEATRAACRQDGEYLLIEDTTSLFDAVAQATKIGELKLELRARPGQKKRTAQLEARATTVILFGAWRPGGNLPPLPMNVVEVREVNAPQGVEPIFWVLLTSWEIDCFGAVLRVIKSYTRRWLIEEYHKALKTGTSVEESQLATAHNLRALIGVLAIVAVRLLNMKLLAGNQPEMSLEAEDLSSEALQVLEKMHGRPKSGWNNLMVLLAIAKIGGFLGRKSDGVPGWISIWRGWGRLMLIVQGYNLALKGRSFW